jgi:hypothetical protein
MSFRIGRREPIGRAVRRVAAEELAAALANAEDEARPLDERVHAVRVHLKRARAALRLGRRRRVDRALRDAGRALARARDEAIARATLADLGAPPRRAPSKARDGADLARAAAALARVELRAPRASRGAGHAARRAFARDYREARRRLATLRADDAPERFHSWRKVVKRLALQARLLRSVTPALSRQLRAPLDALAERLGDLHDLSVAEARLGPRPPASDLLARLSTRAAGQRAAALALGRRALATRPREVRRQLRAQWRSAR